MDRLVRVSGLDPIPGLSAGESSRLLADLRRDEGWRERPYECSAKKLTVGYGTLLPFTPFEQAFIGQHRNLWPGPGMTLKGWSALPNSVFPLTKDEGEWLLRGRVKARIGTLAQLLRTQAVNFEVLPSDVRLALANMSYQMGASGVMRFRLMVKAIKAGDWKTAANEALDSKWARKDTPERAGRVAALIRWCEDGSRS